MERQLFFLLIIMGIIWLFLDEFYGNRIVTQWARRLTE